MTDESGAIRLRRTLRPYAGMTVILLGITVFLLLPVGAWHFQWNAFWAALFLWGLYFLYVAIFQLPYRVLRNDSGLIMRASGLAERFIPYDQITSVRYEVGVAGGPYKQNRPFRRVVVRGRKGHPKEFVDISLRHFRVEDIQAALAEIQNRRPDIELPKIQVWGKSIWP